jgi:UDPglucose 6-dehydrogenase
MERTSNQMKTKVCIVGTGYVGMASAIGLAALGCEVSGYDILPERVAGLRAGITPYREEGIEEQLQTFLANGSIAFFHDFAEAAAGAKFIILTVGTPASPDGSSDMSGLDAAVDAILSAELPSSAVIVLRSTVPVGTSDIVAARLGARHTVIYQPEFLREGTAVYDFMHPDRVVIGGNDTAAAVAYASIFEALECRIVITTPAEAELIKAWSNAFLAMKITFANEVANFCGLVNADVDHVLRAVGYDRRIGELFLKPGPGFGGPCFEKDVKSLKQVSGTLGEESRLLGAVLEINDLQPRRVVDALEGEMGNLQGTTIGVWGLAFKAGTSDVRDSLALRILEELALRGATVRAFDPAVHALPAGFEFCQVVNSELQAACADALLVLTEWPQFALADPATYADLIARGVVIDARNVLDPERVTAAGLSYRGMGRAQGMRKLSLAKAG